MLHIDCRLSAGLPDDLTGGQVIQPMNVPR